MSGVVDVGVGRLQARQRAVSEAMSALMPASADPVELMAQMCAAIGHVEKCRAALRIAGVPRDAVARAERCATSIARGHATAVVVAARRRVS